MIDLLYLLAGGVACGLIVACPGKRRGNGRHVSRPLGRILGWTRIQVHAAQAVFVFAIVGLSFPYVLAALIGQGIFIVWLVDDWLTGDNDKPGRKHEWAKVQLRKIKPVKLRPAETLPSGARVSAALTGTREQWGHAPSLAYDALEGASERVGTPTRMQP